ncbi:ATP-grasp domain-containing protein [Candidatus Formimonas warabiya]|uniref:Carbamoylphosphate synthase large subunit n=1 Tax=Formimonas warabiya TaxID=1761012 RepID=A0A3G1KTC5_FORW1|nr:ATP-grasp domain-containing protein [Candidatus Formimonas warabiya]ATW25680.1 carbamoylphosphate synthase large subunit [Candidatus Formimonas warabiya]
MTLNILTEASGSLTSAYLIKAVQEAGYRAVASDINPDCAGRYLADDFILMPSKNDINLWEKVVPALAQRKVNLVIPSLDETMLGWAERKKELKKLGIHVVISEESTVKIFQDKWLTYRFFLEKGIPTPKTSLEQQYPLVKPRQGRGAVGVVVTSDSVNMEGMISQEVIEGEEYTIDVFCDKISNPIYIVPRKRQGVKDGKSTGGIVVKQVEIISWVEKICKSISFIGPINLQCFVCKDETIKFTEINPRVAGGMALGFAATENWINLIVDHFFYDKDIKPKPIKFGMKMMRYYAEVFVS